MSSGTPASIRGKSSDPTELRIVLIGGRRDGNPSGKSSLGNIILGRDLTGPRSVDSEVRHGVVAGRHLTMVDSPGWFYNSPLQSTSEMDKLEIQKSVYLCPPGPHGVLLMVPLHDAFTKAQRLSVEEHMTLLTQGVWSHTIVVFTNGDCLGDTSIEQHIEAEGEDLRWLVDKCGNRYYVFNNEKKDDTQVTELLKKIEEMVAGNRGGHYEVDGDVAEKLSERKRNIVKRVQTLMTGTLRQRTALKALFEGEHQSLPDVRLMLVGGEQYERSKAGNHILQKIVFTETLCKEFKTQTKLTQCARQQSQVAERNVSVVICPDWSTTTPPSQKIKDVLLHGVTLCSPGPHAVLLTVSVMSSFSEADRKSVEEHMELLGDRVWKHILVLFTWGWWLGERRVEEYIESEGEPLRWLLEKCDTRYHVLQFSKWDSSEVTELMEKIEDMVTRNRGPLGPLVAREDGSVRDTGHFRVGHETRQKTPFERLIGKQTLTAEEWKKAVEAWRRREEEWRSREEEWRSREEEMIDRMLKFVVKEPEEPTLPAVRRQHSMDFITPSLSGGTPSETGICTPNTKVTSWLLEGHPGPMAHYSSRKQMSSGYDTFSEAPSQADTDTGICVRDDEDVS